MNCKTTFVKINIRLLPGKRTEEFDGILSNKGDKEFIFIKSFM